MKTALFDCFSGASGDMIVGALLDAGLRLGELRRGLATLGLKGASVTAKKSSRRGIAGTRFHVAVRAQHHARSLDDMERILRRSALPLPVRDHAIEIFRDIARVEAKIHGVPVAKVHFHEIGAVDSIVDIAGACYGLHKLGVEKVFFTPPALGSGWVQTEHGKFPVPAPATVALLRNIPARWGEPCPGEWTTPTAAAILAHFGQCVETLPSFAAGTVAYGIGHRDPESHPNVLRLILADADRAVGAHTVWSVQTNIDDMPSQCYGHVMEQLFKAGAWDVFFIPIQMKKNRPGTLLEVLCDDARLDAITNILLSETSTFGLRMQKMQRRILERESRTVKTSLGMIRFKIGKLHGKVIKSVPEFDDCQAAAHKYVLPLPEVYRRLAKAL